MSTWTWLLLATALCFGLKLVGHLVPPRLLSDPRLAHAAAMVTVGLLAALVAVQTVASGTSVSLDARLPAVLAAAGALALRAPFIVVVLVGATVAAGLRAAGGS